MMNQNNLMRQMQNRLVKIQEELATETVEATAGGGVVKATAFGAAGPMLKAVEVMLVSGADAAVKV